jgi:predicted DNA-binding protein
MPTAKPRIAITLPPHTHEVIRRLAELNGQPMSKIVAELVEAVSEPLMRTVALLEAAAAAPKQIKDGLRGTVQAMERELYGAAGYTLGQMDWLINEMGKGEAERERGGVPPAPSAPPSRASGRAKSNPHTVIRGSGQAKPLKSKESGVSGKRVKKGGKNG